MNPITKKYIAFFRALAGNNNREWFHENKKRYENDVKAPFESLVQQLITMMQKLDPEILVTPKECIFRIYRDTRFSKDKTPYKLHMAAGVGRDGKSHSSGRPGIYFQLGPEEIAIAGGLYKPEKEMLARIRQAIVDDPARVRRILEEKKFRETFGGIGDEDKNKLLPKEFREYGNDLPILFNKSYHYWKAYKGQKHLLQENLAGFIVDHYKIARGWNDFISEAIA
jgi:uncharacterized protein (TIGR02453 family)